MLKTYSNVEKIYLIVSLWVITISGTIITTLFPAYQISKGVVALPFNDSNIAATLVVNKTTILTSNNTFSRDTIASNSSTVSTNKTIEPQEIFLVMYFLAIEHKMVVTKQQVIDMLNPDEPNYPEAAKLGPDALPHLDTLVKTADPLLASKATYLASLIQDEQSIDVLKAAAQSNHPEVRVAAAAGARNLSVTETKDILFKLLADEDIGVREEAMNTLKKLCNAS